MDISAAIRSDITSFSSLFEPWASKLESDLLNQERTQAEDTLEAKEFINNLNNDRMALLQLQSTQESECSEFKTKLNNILSDLDKLNMEAKTTLPAKLTQLTIKQQQTQSEYELIKQTTENTQLHHFNSLSAISKIINLFQNRLGLAFTVDQGKLNIIYSYINPKQWELQYQITIFIDENNEYQYDSTTKPIEINENTIKQYISQLNRDNQFGWFVQKNQKIICGIG